jgi:hypothetical protein
MIGALTGTQRLRALVFPHYKLKLIILTASLLLASAFPAYAKDWRGIVPLHSVRSDVERLLGIPRIAGASFATYELERTRVTFDYSTGGCNDGTWNVSPGTVVSIFVTPRGLKFRDMGLDLKKFKKVQDDETLHIFHYIDEQEGVRYEVDESDETVPLIHYFPAKKDEHLRCPCVQH